MKRLCCLFLILALLFGMVPTAVFAENSQKTTVLDEGMTVEGTNSFGSLLANDLQQEESEDLQHPGGYSVIGLTVEDNVATVEYDTLETARLVVAIYTEDGMRLLVSGTAEVSPEESEAQVTLEGEMPEYFMASAYLLDTYDYSPLCASYDTPMYTREMQELLASTVEDYDLEKVLQLDEDTTTNFAVFAEDTILIEEREGVNEVISIDDETATYVIGNADSTITSLQPGDVFAYPYGEEDILIVKVAQIVMDGTTATIAGSDLEMEEVFSYVKLENTGDAADMEVDDDSADEGVTFEGLVQPVQTYNLRTRNSQASSKNYLSYTLDKEVKTDLGNEAASIKIKGAVGLELDIAVSYYISLERQFIDLQTDIGLKLEVSITGKASVKLPLKSFSAKFFGVSIGFEPVLKLECSAKVEYELFAGFTIGLIYDEKGLQPISTTPRVESDFQVEGTLFFGIDMAPTLKVLGGALAKAKLKLPVGLELKAEAAEAGAFGDQAIHSCENCIAMELRFKLELSAELKMLKSKKLTFTSKTRVLDIKLSDFYWSLDEEEFGKGQCPYVNYRVTVQVNGDDGKGIADTTVFAQRKGDSSGASLGTTNSKGALIAYLSCGQYTFRTEIAGKTAQKTVSIDSAQKLLLTSASGDTDSWITSGGTDADSFVDYGSVILSGECGAQGDNAIWVLHENGLLRVEGKGEIADYKLSEKGPWYGKRQNIERVYISEGITGIGKWAFADCDNLEQVVISEGVSAIKKGAFGDCDELISVSIPESVVSIEDQAFSSCDKLKIISIPRGINIIDSQTFYECRSLESIAIPDTVTSIKGRAFAYCENMSSVVISESVKTIEYNVFFDCDKLTNVYYRGTEEQWQQMKVEYGNNAMLNATIHFNSTGPEAALTALPVVTQRVTTPTLGAVFGGEYGEEVTDEATIKTAFFQDLVPGGQYVLLAIKSVGTEDVLAAENLLYIRQAATGEDGTLSFRYVQRESVVMSFVLVCGASNKSLQDAIITFPTMLADEEIQAVKPAVVYDGVTLTEGQDYVVVGTVDYTEAGTYTCFIRGIRSYTGLVECSYTVLDAVAGDMNDDGQVTDADAMYLLRHTLFPERFLLRQSGDVNGDGEVTDADALYLLRFTLFPQRYPLK